MIAINQKSFADPDILVLQFPSSFKVFVVYILWDYQIYLCPNSSKASKYFGWIYDLMKFTTPKTVKTEWCMSSLKKSSLSEKECHDVSMVRHLWIK